MKLNINFKWLFLVLFLIFLFACKEKVAQESEVYTCPMPQDSVFTNKPGKCPKCGMTLIKLDNHNHQNSDSTKINNVEKTIGYTCPMHPQIIQKEEGTCPICGMQLEKIKSKSEENSVSLNTLLKPVNQQVVANIPMLHIMAREENIELESYGVITYDTRNVAVIAANISGRIEKLYVKYRYQKINKGQKILDIYSPELLTAQENLLFLFKNDQSNQILINASKQKLLLLGMSDQQLNKIISNNKADFLVSVYSNYSGHIHESISNKSMTNNETTGMKDANFSTQELSLKEGMYIQKGQNIFSVFNPNKAWAVLNIFNGQESLIKVGDKVRITPETNTQKEFRASINFIEPFFREKSKTQTVRVYFNNNRLEIPIGSQVKATIFAGNKSANWLPEESVLTLGLDKVVFVRNGESFIARKIETGIINKHLIQVLNGINKNEAVAANAQYLIDSESFIKTN